VGGHSLRDVIANLQAQSQKLYHLGVRTVTRSSLARVNEQQPYQFYENLFAQLAARCQQLAPRHGFRFRNKLYSLDASLIDLSLAIFPWAHYALGKAAMKLHVGLDHAGHLPVFAAITHGHTSDLAIARTLSFPKGSVVVCDKGYMNYAWFKALTDRRVFFVTRPRKNALAHIIARRTVNQQQGLTSDHTVQFYGSQPQQLGLRPLRQVGYRDPATKKHYVFLTNAFHLSAKTIADIYKQRWQIELFFKWLKQNLKIKTFLGTSRNAVLTQIWVALCLVLLLAYLKFEARLNWSLHQMLRLLQLNLFLKRELLSLLRGEPPLPPPGQLPNQLVLV